MSTGAGAFALESGATLRTSLGVDAAGTDNSTDVTIAGTPDYVTLSGQVLTRGLVDVTTDITGIVPIANLATGTPDGSKFLRDDGVLAAIPGGGDALVASPLSQFAATTSAQLAGVLSDETGTGAAVFGTSPTLVTPNLGTPSAAVLTNATGYPGDASLVTVGTVATGTWQGTAIADAYISGAAGWDAKQSQADILDDIGALSAPGAADQVLVSTGAGAFALESGATLRTSLGLSIGFDVQPYNPTVADSSNTLAHFSSTTSAQLAGVLSDETGTGAAVFGTSPTLVTPNLGTPSAAVLTNATGLPVAGLAASTSADLATVLSDETGTGAAVFGTLPYPCYPRAGYPPSCCGLD